MKAPTSSIRGRKSSKQQLADGEYTVDDLARRGNTTVRNIRAYQDRGILAPPVKRGRLGIYNDDHAARLDIINNLLDRGYTIENIRELLAAWTDGRDLEDLLGLERAITQVFNSEQPREYTISELLKMFGIKAARKSIIDEAVKLGLLERKRNKFVAPSPKLIEAGEQMVKLGMSFEEIIELMRLLRGNVQRAADGLVKVAVDRFDEFGDDLPPPETLSELSRLIWELKPVAHQAIRAEAELALNRSLRNFLGDRLSAVIEHLHE
jgi:DNA-binding transcriptional MerR regulator